jgi:hypothetical protein
MIIPNKFNGYSADGIRTYCKGGGSNKAYKLQKQQQEQMQKAIAAINEIFGGETGSNPLSDISAYNPAATYYNADGSVYQTPTKNVLKEQYANGTVQPEYITPYQSKTAKLLGVGGGKRFNSRYYDTVTDNDALQAAIAAGNVYQDKRNARQDLYDQQNQAVYELNKNKLDEDYADAARTNRFALARNGLTGGSADIDSMADLQDRYAKGLVDAKGLGQTAAADLQQADETAKSNLISLAEAGLDAGSAANQATSSLNSNYQSALGDRSASTIANYFNNMGQLYLTNKLNQAMQDAYANGYYGSNNSIGSLNTRSGSQGDTNRY